MFARQTSLKLWNIVEHTGAQALVAVLLAWVPSALTEMRLFLLHKALLRLRKLLQE